MSVTQILDDLVQRGVFHWTNTFFEGSIGLVHLLSNEKIYGAPLQSFAVAQFMFGKFFGLIMVAMATISYGARTDRKVAEGLALYHCSAAVMNFLLGCGMDGLEDRSRDLLHSFIHDFLGLGFSWMVYRGHTKAVAHLHLKGPWDLRGNSLQLEIVMKNWQAAIDAIQEYSKIAEYLDHHPEIHLTDYRKLRLVVRTFCKSTRFQLDDITDRDIELASSLEAVPIAVSEKWAKETDATWVVPLKNA